MERKLKKDIEKDLQAKHISLIIGARQTGKTTILKQILSGLKNKKKSAFYLTLEDKEILKMLNENPKNLLQLIAKPEENERRYVLIDEIQYLNDPSNFLKYHYDTYLEKIKFIVTGSSSFYIDRKFKDSLAGRKRIYELPTMSLKEVLIFKGEDELAAHLNAKSIPLLYLDRIKEYFYEYLIYGGYPEAVLSGSESEKKLVLKEIADSYVKKDAAESNLSFHDKYQNLMKMLASRTGSLLNINSLAADAGLDNKTAAQ
ncbi:MAG: AAA family ATPase, partial [Candidatus Delongbacteria bacterium]